MTRRVAREAEAVLAEKAGGQARRDAAEAAARVTAAAEVGRIFEMQQRVQELAAKKEEAAANQEAAAATALEAREAELERRQVQLEAKEAELERMRQRALDTPVRAELAGCHTL